ncbi:efflux RND transporter periplasmic adaptor subunit [Nonlabens marinus]|nr:efflux RND transporter periplasmic adaptor subunit [Nonlabens marinus]
MNKNILYIAIAIVIGLLAGWLIFGDSGTDTASNKDLSDLTENHDHDGETASQMWTCSMHPQIMQPEPGDCPICGMDLIPAESSAEGLAMNEIKMTDNAVALANIQTTIVGTGKTSSSDGVISLSGKIATNEENNTIQASYFDGRIERLNVNYEGQQVSRGQLLATIYSPSLIAAQQELLTAASLKDSQPALYNAVRNKLRNWKVSESQINAIESSGKVRENFPVYATVSGTVVEVMAREGDYVKQGQPILKVSNLGNVWAEFDAYESSIAQFKKGQNITITTNAYPNKEFDATISFIDPILNTATRTVTVRATLNNKENLFKPGMFVTGKVKGTTPTVSNESVTVPASAVLWTGERSLVYVKTNPNEPVFEIREVTLSNRNGDTYIVVSGLRNGEEIVTNGTFTVDAAAQLQGKKSMMNQGKEDEAMMPMAQMEMSLPIAFQQGFKKALPSYYKMKDAFVSSDAVKVSAFAKATSQQLKSLSTSSLGAMEQSHFKKSIEMLEAIVTNDLLENQRAHFVILNENMVALAKNIASVDSAIYVQKCPMADNNKGALWLSTEKNIRNPYYGEQMMTCGSVIETIQ